MKGDIYLRTCIRAHTYIRVCAHKMNVHASYVALRALLSSALNKVTNICQIWFVFPYLPPGGSFPCSFFHVLCFGRMVS